jgi:catechol 2,3-dioxygenase-like lactoylglutathione lyase family enzyme
MNVNRREALTLLAGAATAVTALAQDQEKAQEKGKGGPGKGKGGPPFVPSGPALPLKTTGLEHIGLTIPNPEASAKFYGQIFDPQLFKERDIANRFYCRMGKAYLAFGTNANVTQPKIDHYCALVENYNAQYVSTALAAVGITMGTGPTAMPTDADGMRLQLLGVPGGLAGTIIPASRISQEDAIVQAIGLDHITQWVSNLDASAKFYGSFFGKESSRNANRVTFDVARTKLVLEKAPAGEAPRVHHFTFRVAGLNKKETTAKLTALGAKIAPSGDEGFLRFQDLDGFLCELKPA